MDRLLTRNKWLKPLLVACVLIPISIFITHTDFKLVVQEMAKIGYRFLWLLVTTFSAYLLGSLAWWVCLGADRHRISVLRLFVVRQVCETVSLYNPSSIIGGDLLKGELLKPYRIASDAAANSVVVSRITVVLSQLSIFVAACIWLLHYSAYTLPRPLFFGISVLCFLFIVIHIVVFWLLGRRQSLQGPRRVQQQEALKQSFIKRVLRRLGQLLLQARNFYQEKPRLFWLSYVFSFLHWIVGSLEFYLILVFFGFDIRLMHGVLLDMGVVIVKSAGAFVPGQIGIEEIGNKLVLLAIGIQATSVWLAVSILRRSRQLFWILVGFICYTLLKKTSNIIRIDGSPVR